VAQFYRAIDNSINYWPKYIGPYDTCQTGLYTGVQKTRFGTSKYTNAQKHKARRKYTK